MTAEQILKLVEAGYTKAEIAAMETPKAAEPKAADPAPAKEPEKKAEPEQAKAPEKAADPAGIGQQIQDLINKQFEDINTKLAATIKAAAIPSMGDTKPITDLADIISKVF